MKKVKESTTRTVRTVRARDHESSRGQKTFRQQYLKKQNCDFLRPMNNASLLLFMERVCVYMKQSSTPPQAKGTNTPERQTIGRGLR